MFRFILWLWVICTNCLQVFFAYLFPLLFRAGCRKQTAAAKTIRRYQPKPAWVKKYVIRLKALMLQASCRSISQVFNRRFMHKTGMSVGKTYVSEVIRNNRYEIDVIRKKIKHRPPRTVPINLVWGMDMTGKKDAFGNMHTILGIVEHGSRLNLYLAALNNKASITLLRMLCDVVEQYGKPKFLRTDNEAVFTSRLFRFGLWVLGIRHQRIEKHCPWQNGRVERFFGTLKNKLDQWQVATAEELATALSQFRFWYNHVRPHQNLAERTPAEAWNNINVFEKGFKKEYWFEAWDGLLTGFYLKE